MVRQSNILYRGLGIVYGDIGTSPLYVFQNIFLDVEPTRNDVYGATSLVLWTIILIVLVKYSLVVLLADDNGEGEGALICCIPKLQSSKGSIFRGACCLSHLHDFASFWLCIKGMMHPAV